MGSILDGSQLSAMAWMEALGILGIAVLAGFLAGIIYSRMTAKVPSTILEAAPTPGQLIGRLEKAVTDCDRLRKSEKIPMETEDRQQLETFQRNLMLGLTELLQKVVRVDARRVRAFVKTPTDPHTGLPSFLAFKENLDVLLGMQERSKMAGGVLLVRIDKYAQLLQRFGPGEVTLLTKTFIELLRNLLVRGESLCSWDEETLGIVIPPRGSAEIVHLADTLRRSVRSGRFELSDNRSEVLFTANFGLVISQLEDTEERLFARAKTALRCAEDQGRNQLALFELDSLRVITREPVQNGQTLLPRKS